MALMKGRAWSSSRGLARRDVASLPRHTARVAAVPDQTRPHVPVSWRTPELGVKRKSYWSSKKPFFYY